MKKNNIVKEAGNNSFRIIDYAILIGIFTYIINLYLQKALIQFPITDEMLAMMRAPKFIHFSIYWKMLGTPFHFLPLYYIMLGLYEKLVGFDVFYLRLLSVFFVLLGSIFFFKICLFFMEKYSAYLALVFFLSNSAIVNYCIYLERYALFICLSLTTIYFYLSGLKDIKYNNYMIISLILLSLTHIYFVSIFIIIFVHSLFYFKDDLKEWKIRYFEILKVVSILTLLILELSFRRILFWCQSDIMPDYTLNIHNIKMTFMTISTFLTNENIILVILIMFFLYALFVKKKDLSFVLLMVIFPLLLSILYAFFLRAYSIRDTALLMMIALFNDFQRLLQ